MVGRDRPGPVRSALAFRVSKRAVLRLTSRSRVSCPLQSWCLRSLEAELGRCFQKAASPLVHLECLLCTQLYPESVLETAEWGCPDRHGSGPATAPLCFSGKLRARLHYAARALVPNVWKPGD